MGSFIRSLREVLGSRVAPFLVAAFLCLHVLNVHAGTIWDFKDLISNSAPGDYANHTIEFKTTVPIPPGGFVRFIPDPGQFTIPGTDLDLDNVEFAIATSSGYVDRVASGTPSLSEDGISIATGTEGSIEVTLNGTVGIPADAFVRMKIGNHTANATGTDLGIQNPNASGTYAYIIEAGDTGTTARVTGRLAILGSVGVGPFDTREFIPPVRFNGAPSGTISGTTEYVEMSLETDEFSRCRFSTASNTPYYSMGNEFTSSFAIMHAVTFAVATGTTYNYYIRCVDDEGNINDDDYLISFIVPDFPEGVPGDDGDDEGQGTGTGLGSGEASPGEGDPSGNDQASGGGGGGGSGGGGGKTGGTSSIGNDGGGGFENTGQPYQSGDGLVIINGYAFPRSDVYILVDGVQAKRVNTDSTGSFSVELDEIARGVYTFGVYAVDPSNVRSSTFSTTFSVTGARGSTLSNVNVMPSIVVTPNPVNPGQQLTISGYSIPNAVVTIENQRDKSAASLKTFTAQSNASGRWSIEVDTNGFTQGTYKVRAKARQEGGDQVETNFSGYTFYGVGQAAETPRSPDLNRDGKVNLIDFSILLFWWNTDGGNSNPPADINGDGKVSLTDFSIMIFNWTG